MATIKKLVSVSNGNAIFVTDLSSMAETMFGMMNAWPVSRPFCVAGGAVSPPNSLRINKGGGVMMYGKFFPTPDGAVLTIPKGSYLYARAADDTSEVRTSTSGQQYYQNIVYTLEVTTSAKTGTTTDYEAEKGLWEIINGATTAAMETTAWVSYIKQLSVLWSWSSIDNNLPSGIVATSALASGAVTSEKLANGAITSLKFSAGLFPGLFNAKTIASSTLSVLISPWDYAFHRVNGASSTNVGVHLSDANANTGCVAKLRIHNNQGTQINVTVVNTDDSSYSYSIPQGEARIFEFVYLDSKYEISVCQVAAALSL